MKKIIIFGGGGFVGGNLAKTALENNYDVTIIDNRFRSGIDGAKWIIQDITDVKKVRSMIEDIQPNAVVNAAAIANIDFAQRNKELTKMINVDSAVIIAESCMTCHAKHIFISSDAVYKGNEIDYKETSLTNPVNFYGKTKLEAEKKILDVYDNLIILRLSLVLGMPVTDGNSFIASMIKRLEAKKEIYCPQEEIRTPIDVYTLCDCILEFIENDQQGIYNIGATESLDRYDMSIKLAEKLGLDTSLIKKATYSINATERADRHKNGILSVTKAEKVLKTKLLNIEDTLVKAIKTLT